MTHGAVLVVLVAGLALSPAPREAFGQAASGGAPQAGQQGTAHPADPVRHPPELEELLRKMEATYQDVRTYRAEFEQETETKSLRRTRKSSGWIYIEKPARVRWSYREPDPQEIYVLPDHVYIWLPDRNQVMKTSESELPGMAQVRVMLAQGKLSESFAITLLAPDIDPEGFHRLRLVPKSGTRISLTEMILFVRKKDLLLEQTESRDLLGNVTRISFRNWEINAKFDENLFQFRIPEGAEVLKEAF